MVVAGLDSVRSEGAGLPRAAGEILCADIGGTNTRMAVVRPRPRGGFETVASQRLRSADFDGLESAIDHFFRSRGLRCRRAAFGIAGPVVDGRCALTNRPWKAVDAEAVRQTLGFDDVLLINDLEALAWAIPLLAPGAVETLHEGQSMRGNRALAAVGTGFGQAGIYWNGRDFRPFATEGGHTHFGPRNELEVELLRFLWTRYDRVSWERVVSGMGLANLFDFFVHRGEEADRELAEEVDAVRASRGFRPGEEAAAISSAAIEERCEVASRALDLMVDLYASEAGNLALKTNALGGVYLGGGIPPRILGRLRSKRFRSSFCDKGRMQGLLEGVPLHVILDQSRHAAGHAAVASSAVASSAADETALYGAALYGAALALLVASRDVRDTFAFCAGEIPPATATG